MEYITNEEKTRRRAKRWDSDFKSPKEYVEFKLTMLRNEMYIEPTDEEVRHLYELNSMGDIDRAVHTIIERHWE